MLDVVRLSIYRKATAVCADNNTLCFSTGCTLVVNACYFTFSCIEAVNNLLIDKVFACPINAVAVFVRKVGGVVTYLPQVVFCRVNTCYFGCGYICAITLQKYKRLVGAVPQNRVAFCLCGVKFCHVNADVLFHNGKHFVHCVVVIFAAHRNALVESVYKHLAVSVLALLDKVAEHRDEHRCQNCNYCNYNNQFHNGETAFFVKFHNST